MRRLGRLVLGRHWEVSGSSLLLQRGRRLPGCVLDDFALRNFVRASLLNDQLRECSSSTSVTKRPESGSVGAFAVVQEEGDDESEEEEEEEGAARLGSFSVQEEGDDESDEEEEGDDGSEEEGEEEVEGILSEDDLRISSDSESDVDLEDMGLSEAEARLSGTDDEESGDDQLDAELEEAEKLLADENDEGDVQSTKKKKKKSYVHKLTIEDVSKVLEKLRPIDLKILNVQERCDWADYMVFVTGRSSRHIRGMADMIVSAVKKKSTQDNHNLFPTVEGRECEDWMLVDCGNIIIHVFSEEARARYNLEAKWSGAEVLQIGDGEEGDTGSEGTQSGSESEGVARTY